MSIQHPCPLPDHPRKGARDGDLWACVCGKVHVRRHWRNYAGEGFEWQATRLNTTLLGPDAHTKQKGARDGLPRGAPVTASDARPPSDTGTTGCSCGVAAYDGPGKQFLTAHAPSCRAPYRPVIVVDPAEARETIAETVAAHAWGMSTPDGRWRCVCHQVLNQVSHEDHVAAEILAALGDQEQR